MHNSTINALHNVNEILVIRQNENEVLTLLLKLNSSGCSDGAG